MRGGGRPMSAAPIIPSCPEVLVLRHGQTEWNAEGRLQGHLDSPLTEKLACARPSGRMKFYSPMI